MTTDSACIIVGEQTYTRARILAWRPEEAGGLGENARAALDFARAWLAGDQHFALHTSGSTGAPKPITLTRRQMEASAYATGSALGLRAGGQALVCLPTAYVAGRMMLVRGLVLGLDLHVVEPSADPLAALAPAAHIDFAAFVPLQMQTLLARALQAPADSCYADETEAAFRYRRLLDGMQAILLGGGPLSAPLYEQVRRLSAPVYHTYGMTETATHIALRRLNGDQATEAFRPLPGVELALDSRDCLAIRGPMSADEWVQTNDLVELRADRSFIWLGRADNVINSGGVKVHIEKVEAKIEAMQAARSDLAWAGRRSAIVPTPDERLGQAVTLVLEGPPLTAAEEEEMAAILRAALDRFELPRRFAYLPHLPQTPTGKIDRTGLLAALA